MGTARKPVACLAFWLLGAGVVQAQWAEAPAWTEIPQSPPAHFSTDRLLDFKVSTYSELSYGVDPTTVSLGEDGVVRYVMVAQSSRAQNILYEGIRCATGEVRTYARWHPGTPGQWHIATDSTWRPLSGNNASRPARILAQEAFCDGSNLNGNVDKMLRDLRYGRPVRQ